MINICFLFDCTYQTEHISTVPGFGELASFLWIVTFAAKLITLAWIFRVQVSWVGYAIPILAAAGIAVGPHLLYYSGIDKFLIHLAFTWYGVLLAIVFLLLRPAAAWEGSPDPSCRVVFSKIWTAAWIIWGGFYLFHIMSWIRFYDIDVSLANLAPIFAILPFLSEKEEYGWVGLTLVMVLSLGNPSYFFLAALLCGLIFMLCSANGPHPRMYVGTIVCLHLALRTVGWQEFPLPDPDPFLVVLTGVALLVVGWAYRLISALLVATFGGVAYWSPTAPRNIMEWGALFIAAGFVSLVAGVAANWWFRFVSSDTDKQAVKGR